MEGVIESFGAGPEDRVAMDLERAEPANPVGAWTLAYRNKNLETVRDAAVLNERLGLARVLEVMRKQGTMFVCDHCGVGFQSKPAIHYHVKNEVLPQSRPRETLPAFRLAMTCPPRFASKSICRR